MKKTIIMLSGIALFLIASMIFFSASVADARKPLSPSDRATGLVYDGLKFSEDGECNGLFEIDVPGSAQGEAHCTHGPDPITFALARPSGVPTPTPAPASTAVGAILCDGDGVTGKRVQVLYARASTTPSRYSAYLAAFRQWAADADAYFNASAAQTGGSRRIRFVHDASCKPVVTEVVLSAWGTEAFGNMISELRAQGFNRTDRKYMVFMDAGVYCGIADIVNDDSSSKGNKSNTGPHYGRIDSGCWSGTIAAHELMHTLGGVQLSAPHSDGNFHCNDGYDNMCDHSGHTVQITCPDTAGDSLMDCNHDDYFSTNPPANSYLATHWNAANNQFLIAPTTSTKK